MRLLMGNSSLGVGHVCQSRECRRSGLWLPLLYRQLHLLFSIGVLDVGSVGCPCGLGVLGCRRVSWWDADVLSDIQHPCVATLVLRGLLGSCGNLRGCPYRGLLRVGLPGLVSSLISNLMSLIASTIASLKTETMLGSAIWAGA